MSFRLAGLIISSAAVTVAVANTIPFKKDSCELENGFKYEECGTMDKVKVCCSAETQCVSAKPWEGDEKFECSKERLLSGNKLVKIVLLPVVLAIMFLGVAGYMIKSFPKTPDMGLCLKQVILSVFLLFSPAWTLGFWTVILNFLVASAVNMKGLAWWAYRLLFFLQIFHIIAVFGPFDSFHVPFGDLSTYTDTKALETAPFWATEAMCTTYYDGYFTLLPIEWAVKDVNPNQKTFGYCLEEWLTTVHFLCMIVGVLQGVIAFRTGQLLLGTTSAASGKKDDYVEPPVYGVPAPETSI